MCGNIAAVTIYVWTTLVFQQGIDFVLHLVYFLSSKEILSIVSLLKYNLLLKRFPYQLKSFISLKPTTRVFRPISTHIQNHMLNTFRYPWQWALGHSYFCHTHALQPQVFGFIKTVDSLMHAYNYCEGDYVFERWTSKSSDSQVLIIIPHSGKSFRENSLRKLHFSDIHEQTIRIFYKMNGISQELVSQKQLSIRWNGLSKLVYNSNYISVYIWRSQSTWSK